MPITIRTSDGVTREMPLAILAMCKTLYNSVNSGLPAEEDGIWDVSCTSTVYDWIIRYCAFHSEMHSYREEIEFDESYSKLILPDNMHVKDSNLLEVLAEVSNTLTVKTLRSLLLNILADRIKKLSVSDIRITMGEDTGIPNEIEMAEIRRENDLISRKTKTVLRL